MAACHDADDGTHIRQRSRTVRDVVDADRLPLVRRHQDAGDGVGLAKVDDVVGGVPLRVLARDLCVHRLPVHLVVLRVRKVRLHQVALDVPKHFVERPLASTVLHQVVRQVHGDALPLAVQVAVERVVRQFDASLVVVVHERTEITHGSHREATGVGDVAAGDFPEHHFRRVGLDHIGVHVFEVEVAFLLEKRRDSPLDLGLRHALRGQMEGHVHVLDARRHLAVPSHEGHAIRNDREEHPHRRLDDSGGVVLAAPLLARHLTSLLADVVDATLDPGDVLLLRLAVGVQPLVSILRPPPRLLLDPLPPGLGVGSEQPTVVMQ